MVYYDTMLYEVTWKTVSWLRVISGIGTHVHGHNACNVKQNLFYQMLIDSRTTAVCVLYQTPL